MQGSGAKKLLRSATSTRRLPSFFPAIDPLVMAVVFSDGQLARDRASTLSNEHLAVISRQRLAGLALDLNRAVPFLPEQAVRRLRDEQFDQMSRCSAMLEVTVPVLGRLQGAGITCLVIKGPSLAQVYPRSGMRPYTDLDIMVPLHQYDRARSLLTDMGLAERLDNTPPRPYFENYCMEGINLESSEGARVDLHHHVPPWLWGTQLTFDHLEAQAATVIVGTHQLSVASSAHNALVCALHIISDRGAPGNTLMAWRDLYQLCQALPAEAIAQEARATDLSAWTHWVLSSLPTDYQPARLLGLLSKDAGAVPHSVRLRLLGKGALATKPRLAHPLRLPILNAAMYSFGMLVPARGFLRSVHGLGRYPYIAWWRHALAKYVH